MQHVDLSGAWRLQLSGDQVPRQLVRELDARVPGTVHTDLLAAGLIDDPFDGLNEHLTSWIGESDATYRREFEAEVPAPGERVELAFDGIDTVATITLNGRELGRTANMHRSYRFDVTEALREHNRLEVAITSPLAWARRRAASGLERPVTGNQLPYNMIRKEACNFGWDWGPELVTSGIHQAVRLERWQTARLGRVVPLVTVDRGRGRVELRAEVVTAGDEPVRLECTLTAPDGSRVQASAEARAGANSVELEVADPELWWPHDQGSQPLYDCEVRLAGPAGDLDSWQRRIGFRTVEVVTEPDQWGTSFFVRINGRPVYLRGANWIPDDVFITRVTSDDHRRAIDDALAANMNVLRVWGGGVYIDDELADLCDEHGVLLWQDFLFACAAYPEDAETWAEVEAEARENVARLAPHPSLVLWNGNNENVEGFNHWGWQERMEPGADWGLGYYLDLLPRVVREVDPTRPYTPTSPWNPKDFDDPRNPDNGSSHSWEVWNREDYLTYRDTVPRFCAEFGFQGPATRPTIREYIHDEPLTPSSPGMALHEKAYEGLDKLEVGYRPHLPAPRDFDDWHLTTSLNQARAIECGISHFRSWWPRSAGAIIWQLNDCWPVSSWAAVDSQGRRKLLWYALRSLFADHAVTVQPRDEGLAVICSNLSQQAWGGELVVRRVDMAGTVLAEQRNRMDCAPNHNLTVVLDDEVAAAGDRRREILVAEVDGERAWWWFAEDPELELPPARTAVSVSRDGDRVRVTATAQAVVKDLCLVVDRQETPRGWNIRASELRGSLLPGESLELDFAWPADADLDEEHLFVSVNDLLERSRG